MQSYNLPFSEHELEFDLFWNQENFITTKKVPINYCNDEVSIVASIIDYDNTAATCGNKDVGKLRQWVNSYYFEHYYHEESFNLPKRLRNYCHELSDYVSKNKIHAQFERGFTFYIQLKGNIINDTSELLNVISNLVKTFVKERNTCNVTIMGDYLSISFSSYSDSSFDAASKVYKKLYVLNNASRYGVSMCAKSLEERINESSKTSLKNKILLTLLKYYNKN